MSTLHSSPPFSVICTRHIKLHLAFHFLMPLYGKCQRVDKTSGGSPKHTKFNPMQSHIHICYGAMKATHGFLSPLGSFGGSSLLRDRTKIVQRWGEHFEALLTRPSPVDFSVIEKLPNLPSIQSLNILPFPEDCTTIRLLKNKKTPET